ncbi:hypothetical protein NDK50_14795 [Paraburkholderia bryophila]|uniref:hypothetical protein n=1 Tax=Paraburkholderia bryophila TaxID=420952 RepID=UPI00234B798F|nr:hypothetical protein [Paraburkholderia bryophila]WCM18703.1 hypothetical protein NDK50_14795 [Paraburkholderia bryophila]
MRILLVMPHFFGAPIPDATNRSRLASARAERLRSLVAAICSPHQVMGTGTYGLDHGQATAWRSTSPESDVLDLVVCTTSDAHLLDEIQGLHALFRHQATGAEPMMLGFECHKVLRGARGQYDYYGFVEDDVVLTDALFFRKRRLFDQRFGADALLQPNRYEISPTGPVHKLYVDYRLNPHVTARYQNITDTPHLEMPFLDGQVSFERTTYPSAGCFFLSAAQLDRWVDGPHFLDGDLSYLSPLDSAVTLSVMKTFRVYKPVLAHAWFLEVLHASPRWIGSVPRIAPLADLVDER